MSAGPRAPTLPSSAARYADGKCWRQPPRRGPCGPVGDREPSTACHGTRNRRSAAGTRATSRCESVPISATSWRACGPRCCAREETLRITADVAETERQVAATLRLIAETAQADGRTRDAQRLARYAAGAQHFAEAEEQRASGG